MKTQKPPPQNQKKFSHFICHALGYIWPFMTYVVFLTLLIVKIFIFEKGSEAQKQPKITENASNSTQYLKTPTQNPKKISHIICHALGYFWPFMAYGVFLTLLTVKIFIFEKGSESQKWPKITENASNSLRIDVFHPH